MRVEGSPTRAQVAGEVARSEEPRKEASVDDSKPVDEVRRPDDVARGVSGFDENAAAPLTARPTAGRDDDAITRPTLAVRRGLSTSTANDERTTVQRSARRVSAEDLAEARLREARPSSREADLSKADARLTPTEERRVGAAYADGRAAPHQQIWTPAGVGMTLTRAKEQGLHSDADADETGGIAHRAVLGDKGAATPGAPPKVFDASQVAVMARDAGVPLERLDPSQLGAAASFVNGAKDQRDQLGRVHQAIDTLKVNDSGPPQLSKQDVAEVTYDAARVPGHALGKMNDAQASAAYQDVARGLNTPGEHKIKLGSHNLKMTVAANHEVTASKTSKPGFFSKLGSALKKVGGIALTAASFIPGPVGIAARIGGAVMGAVRSVREGSVFGAIAGVAGAFAGGAGALARGATSGTAATIANVSGRLADGARGVEAALSARRGGLGGFLGGVAGAAGGLAGAVGDGAQALSRGARAVERWADRGAGAVSTLDAARRGDLLAAAAGGAQLGGDLAHSASSRVGRALSSAGGTVEAVRRGDYAGAIAGGTQLAASLQSNGDLDDAAKVARASDRLARAVRSGDPLQMTDAAHALKGSVDEATASIRARHAPPPAPLSSRPLDAFAGLAPSLAPSLPGGADAPLPSTALLGTTPLSPSLSPNGAGIPGEAGVGPDGRPLLSTSVSVSVTAMAPGGPLRRGHQGPEVAQLQRDLSDAGFGDVVGKVDGVFGPDTEAALRAFQKKGAFAQTGQLDAATKASLAYSAEHREQARAERLTAQRAVDVVMATAADFKQLSAPGASLAHSIREWESGARALQRSLDDPTTPPSVLQRQRGELASQQRNVEHWLAGRDRELAVLQGAAETAARGAEVVISAFGSPWAGRAYAGVAAGAQELASSGNVRDAVVKALGATGAQLIGGAKASSVGEAVARGLAQSAVQAGSDAIVELRRIQTSDPAAARQRSEAILRTAAERAVAGAAFNGALHPFLDGLSPDSDAGKLVKETAQTALEQMLRDRLLPASISGATGGQ